MKVRSLFILSSMLSLLSAVSAQTKQVTNADLEKYRHQRLEAEKELRENYAKLGFPSPEELERQNAQDAKEREDLAVRLRQQRLEREMVEAEQLRLEAQIRQYQQPIVVVQDGESGSLRYGYQTYWGSFRGRRPFRHYGRDVIWRATPGGVIYEPGGRSSYIWTPRFDVRPSFGWRNPR
jgi:hypothetical protein